MPPFEVRPRLCSRWRTEQSLVVLNGTDRTSSVFTRRGTSVKPYEMSPQRGSSTGAFDLVGHADLASRSAVESGSFRACATRCSTAAPCTAGTGFARGAGVFLSPKMGQDCPLGEPVDSAAPGEPAPNSCSHFSSTRCCFPAGMFLSRGLDYVVSQKTIGHRTLRPSLTSFVFPTDPLTSYFFSSTFPLFFFFSSPPPTIQFLLQPCEPSTFPSSSLQRLSLGLCASPPSTDRVSRA
jgi:hypothetical protein